MSKRPIGHRSFAAACLLLVAVLPLRGQAALTESEALQRGLGRPELQDLWRGAVALAAADRTQAALWPNPTLSYNREQTLDGALASAEDYVSLSQSVEISGRRRLNARAQGDRVQAAQHQATHRRLTFQTELRLRFYEVLAHQRRLQALTGATAQLARAAAIIGKRRASGDASGYEHQRALRERAEAQARQEVEGAALLLAGARLQASLGEPARPAATDLVVGELLPPPPPPLEALLVALAERPDLSALQKEERAARTEEDAAQRGWVPELTLSGGLKTVAQGGTRSTGYLAGLSLPLPLLTRLQDERQRAAARARIAGSARHLALAEVSAEIAGLRAQASALRTTAERFRQEALALSPDLLRKAEVAYQAGELGILELLDAHRGALSAELQTLDLELQARQARIRLDLLAGAVLP